MRWMLDIQLGRRNLSPIQRIAVAEKYRPIYEKQAKKRQSEYYGNQYDKKSGLTEKLPQVQNNKERNPTTDKKLADIADVSEKTYRMGAKILNSDNEDLKKRVQSGETSISAGYKDLIESNLRQRVLGNTNPVKLGRCFIFLNKYYGFERGGNGSNQYEQKAKLLTIANPNIPSNQIELADSYNITRQTMNNYMRMASMIPELEDLVDTGIAIAICAAYMVLILWCAYGFVMIQKFENA